MKMEEATDASLTVHELKRAFAELILEIQIQSYRYMVAADTLYVWPAAGKNTTMKTSCN